ncbi:hypothetical protein ACFQO9_17335 [Chryseobacterium zhengzhouense]|uniref:DUF4376 domain-containing protein n=1 Tax=Chryseobacterium zhengzhouense TaxID=1636086 RepID=A0ABW2M4N6_9FLAO
MLKYYRINYSTDQNIIGSKGAQIDNFYNRSLIKESEIKKYNDNRKNRFIDTSEINVYNFALSTEANLTDILNSNYLFLDGFFISNKLKIILENSINENYKILNTSIYKGENLIENYYFFNVIDTENINYTKTIFRIDSTLMSWRDGGKEIIINNKEELFEKGWEVVLDDATKTILPKKAYINKYTDILRFANSHFIYCSEHLKQKIEEEKLTGVVFEETDIEFCLNE